MKRQLTLEGVRRQFETWRKNKKTPRSRIPEELWDAAVALCEQHSLSKVALTLRLSSNDLKKRIAARQVTSEPPSVVEPTSFIEFSLPAPSKGPDCVVEMENRHGDRMKIYFADKQSADLMALSRAFLEAGS